MSDESFPKWAAAVNDYGLHHCDYKFATGMLKRHYTEIRGNVFPGDTMTFPGNVTGKYVCGGEAFVDVESGVEDQHERMIASGKSILILSQRS